MNLIQAAEALKQGQIVQFRPHGNSMVPKIKSGQLVTVEPLQDETLAVGDIVLCRVKGRYYLHLVKAIKDGQYQIGNNKGHINGWATIVQIFGKVKDVTD